MTSIAVTASTGATSGAIAGRAIIATGTIAATTGIMTVAALRPTTVARRRVIVATGTMADSRRTVGRMTTIVVDGITAARRRMIMATAITTTGIATEEMRGQMTATAGMTDMTMVRPVARAVRP